MAVFRINSLDEIRLIKNPVMQKQLLAEYNKTHKEERIKHEKSLNDTIAAIKEKDALRTPIKRETASLGQVSSLSDKGKTVKLTLPFPPSVNKVFATSRNGGRHLTDEGKNYRNTVHEILNDLKLPLLKGNLEATIWLFRPRNAGDFDNFNKALFDALSQIKKNRIVCVYGIITDDKQIYDAHIYKRIDRINPRVELTLREMEDEQRNL